MANKVPSELVTQLQVLAITAKRDWFGKQKDMAATLTQAANRIEELEALFQALVNHDVAADNREGLHHCVELQDAIEALGGELKHQHISLRPKAPL